MEKLQINPGRIDVYHSEVKGENVPLIIKDSSGQKLKNSSLDLYFERQFADKQTLVLNLVGSYYDSNNGQTMKYEQNGGLSKELKDFQ